MNNQVPFRIKNITTKNFKNIYSLENGAELGNLNILIGPNGSGKSNFIKTLRFLRDSLVSTPATERGITSFEEAVDALGGEKTLDSFVKKPSTVDFKYEFSPTAAFPSGGVLDLSLYVKDRRPFISKELLYSATSDQNNPFYYYKCHDRKSGAGVVSLYENSGKFKKKNTRFQDLASVPTSQLTLSYITELLEQSKFSPEETPVYRFRRQLLETVSQWRFYNANEMNLYDICHAEPKIGPNDTYLSATGENLPLVLDNLVQENYEFEERINNAMKTVLPETRRIRAIRSGRLNLTVEWHTGAPEPFYLSDMSDGTVRMLCWAVVLHSPLLPTLLVIDEPELSLHPAWMPILAEWIKAAANRTQVIVCTHSPDLLDHFTDRLDSVFCFAKNDDTHFTMRKLPVGELATKLEEGWQLGDLYRVGDPSVGGWPW